MCGCPIVTNGKPYFLFCAGEDSGDNIGESLVRSALSLVGERFFLVGAGGPKMERAGLIPLVNYEELPVSGFGDVVPRYFLLRRSLKKLLKALENPLCKGLVAIDYPGFNMKLVALANRHEKPVLYVAPPQAWAWKPRRAQGLNHPKNTLALFFDFEKAPYEKVGCNVQQMQHPVAAGMEYVRQRGIAKKGTSAERILLFPGSRKSQALRNLPVFLELTEGFRSLSKIVVVVPRQELQKQMVQKLNQLFKGKMPSNLSVELAPSLIEDRLVYYGEAGLALSAPGTVTLELALAGCNAVVCSKPDFLTYVVGKSLIKTPWFSLPNLILGKSLFPEFIRDGISRKTRTQITQKLSELFEKKLPDEDIQCLSKKLVQGKTSEQLMSEFLAQFL